MLKLFSADDHIIEHARVWTDRLPAHLHDVAPHVIEQDGIQLWTYENELGPCVDLFAASSALKDKSQPNEQSPGKPQRYTDMLPGCYDPKERSADFLSNGVVASVSFPSLPRFGGTRFVDFRDKQLADVCVTAYNDFILDEWCPGGAPGMFVPMTICQLWDPIAAAEEIRRCADRGARALSIPENVVSFGLPSYYTDHWDPVWRICEEAQITICMHLATSGAIEQYRPSPEAPHAALITAAAAEMSVAAFVNLIFSPVCSKFPGLKIVFSESGLGWLPNALERADLAWQRKRHIEDLNEESPSEIWRRNLFVCQVEEHLGLQFLEHIGADKVLWELDYPHHDTVFPFAQKHADEVFAAADLSQDDITKITYANSEKLFRWTPAELPAV